jgi:transposase
LFTRNGKGLTAFKVKPICSFQQVFQSTYLFGSYSPFTGDRFELELPYCNSICFQLYLNQFALYKPEELKIVLLDNGKFHKAKELIIPDNIVLLFIPPYSPELNPSEKIWHRLKRAFTNKLHKSLEQVSEFLMIETQKLNNEIVINICSFEYIVSAPFWTNRY